MIDHNFIAIYLSIYNLSIYNNIVTNMCDINTRKYQEKRDRHLCDVYV